MKEENDGIASSLHRSEHDEPKPALFEDASIYGSCTGGTIPVELTRVDVSTIKPLHNECKECIVGCEDILIYNVFPRYEELILEKLNDCEDNWYENPSLEDRIAETSLLDIIVFFISIVQDAFIESTFLTHGELVEVADLTFEHVITVEVVHDGRG